VGAGNQVIAFQSLPYRAPSSCIDGGNTTFTFIGQILHAFRVTHAINQAEIIKKFIGTACLMIATVGSARQTIIA